MCELCQTDSSRTNANRECCRIRRLAKAPKHIKSAYWLGLSATEREAQQPELVAMAAHIRKLRLEAGK